MKKKQLLLILSFVCGTSVFASNGLNSVSKEDNKNSVLSKPGKGTTADVNIAPDGTAYRWGAIDNNTANTGPSTDGQNGEKIADPALNDGDTEIGVYLNGDLDAFNYQAAGVIFSSLKAGISSIAFIQADPGPTGNACFTANLSSEYTLDGTTWIPTGWTVSPDYPYDNSMGFETFTFSGSVLPDVLGVRVSGQVFKDRQGETSMISWNAGVNEVMVYSGGVVPITLSSFTGAASASGNQLAWVTKSEKNNQKFEILSSADGKDFSVIGSVASKAVAGNSNSDLSYTFTDANTSDAYYILKQIDFDGASTSSSVIFVKNGLSDASADVYPNPTTDYLNVSLTAKQAGKFNITLTSTNGQRVYSEGRNIEKGKSTFRINVSNKSTGIYLLNITNDKGEVVLRKTISKK